MKNLRTIFVSFLSTVTLLACGGSDSAESAPAATPGTFQQASAKSSLGQSVSHFNSIKKGASDAKSGALTLMASANGYQSFVTPGAAAGAGSTELGETSLALGTCDCTGTKCTFTDCSDDPKTKLSGTTDVNGDKVLIDLKIDIDQTPTVVSITMKCDLTVSASAVTGTCSTSGNTRTTASGQVVDVSFTTKATYDLKLANGGTTGGTIVVAATSTYAGQVYSGGGTVSFP